MKKETILNDWFMNISIELMEKISRIPRDYILDSAFDYSVKCFNWWKKQPIFYRTKVYQQNCAFD